MREILNDKHHNAHLEALDFDFRGLCSRLFAEYWLIWLFILLNCLDFIFSALLITSGLGSEGNPILAGSLWRMAGIKLVVIALVIRFLSKRGAVLKLVNMGLFLIVFWNVFWFIVLS